ncbi:ribosomal protein S18 acetylase RimI-like enzyme [Kribbella voronezhensis]|uniref:Ribosomal protein S18 acetylase RimI-like enzyme n=1 Tax=Kribbella voronezhensis TaxID=2512212 RepID=A0A4R7TBY7_9ACTN|nr:GNAT family N-acetyltransferase [Kribbella voronezhensis]TDU89574.1 ribosomal protein S18 acetylase RimI-like enzyme [Kribbella voronezhensis]
MAAVVLELTVRDLTDNDLPACSFAGSELHLMQVAEQLNRARHGELDYLAVCTKADLPVAIGAVDYVPHPGAGLLTQFGVHPALQSCGIGTVLVAAAEQRISARGLDRAELAVELSNPRARALYERLGYVAYGEVLESWDQQDSTGAITRYETPCTQMRKSLSW